MNLFKAYLVKYACCACESLSDSDTKSMLMSRLESMADISDKPELEHSAPVVSEEPVSKVVEITVVKSSNNKLIQKLLSYATKAMPDLLPTYNESDESASAPDTSKYVPDLNDSSVKLDTLLSDTVYDSSSVKDTRLPRTTDVA